MLYLALLALARLALATSLEDVEHVVFFMQENRAFDHYFGTLYGVRGFADPNAQINRNGRSVFYQQVNGSLSNATDYLLPWYINAQGGLFLNGTQCMTAGSNDWGENHAALANGSNDMWALLNTPQSLAYFKRQDIPIHYAIADGWTIADMYQEGVMASTYPNRILWQSGSINIAGGAVNSTQGPVMDNNNTPGCTMLTSENFLTNTVIPSYMNVSCFPYDWKTIPEYLEDMGVSWWEYQAYDNFGDNPTAYFEIYINMSANAANDTAPLVTKALTMDWYGNGDWQGGLAHFMQDAAAGTLPSVSYIIGPGELSEHPPHTPRQGAWLQKQIVDAVQNSPKYDKTILFVSFDETGGWADHVVPFHSPQGTPGEWINNPFTNTTTFAGPGFRLPFYVISPWTRGGNVFSEPADHTSQIMFLEQWLAARGTPFKSAELNSWRREPDLSLVSLPEGEIPRLDPLSGMLSGAAYCQDKYSAYADADYVDAAVPYGNQTADTLAVEAGFRSVRGALTEGRYLVFESASRALAVTNSSLGVSSPQVQKQTDATQRFVVHAIDPAQADSPMFYISAPVGNSTVYLTSELGLDRTDNAAQWNITHQSVATGYYVTETGSGKYLTLTGSKVVLGSDPAPFKLYSVTF